MENIQAKIRIYELVALTSKSRQIPEQSMTWISHCSLYRGTALKPEDNIFSDRMRLEKK